MTISTGRYFDSCKHTLDYLADEHFEDEEVIETLNEALALVQAAECEIFETGECPICDLEVRALGEDELRRKVKEHRKVIHKS